MNNTFSFLTQNENDTVNIRQVKALYRALKAKDKSLLSKLLVDEPVWDVAPGFPEGSVYNGAAEIFGSFYQKLINRFYSFGALPYTFVDGGNVVIVLGHYQVAQNEGDAIKSVRFAHTWGIDSDGRIKGVWQVADSAQLLIS